MKKIILLSLFLSSCAFAQNGALYEFNTSHFARAMRLGNAYTGVAEGPEAMYFNSAGLANHNAYSLMASAGQGYAFFINGIIAYDLALTIPINNFGTAGVSINTLSFDPFGNESINDNEVVYNIYSLSFARKVLSNLNLGITANYYHTSLSNVIIIDANGSIINSKTISGSAFDVNLAALCEVPVKISQQDIFQIGFQIKNVLGSEMNYDNMDAKDKMFQNMRTGLSYSFVPVLKPIAGYTPLKFMAAFDAVYKGADYRFTEWQPNYGLELTLFEILQLSFGRENELQIKETYSYSPQHPVNRYGIGIFLPLQKIFKTSYGFDVRFDYCKSDWMKIEENVHRIPYLHDRINVKDKAISLGLNIRF